MFVEPLNGNFYANLFIHYKPISNNNQDGNNNDINDAISNKDDAVGNNNHTNEDQQFIEWNFDWIH